MRPGRNRQLRYLATVAEEGQIARAAAKLGVGRSALSEAIAQLESEVGATLLERCPGGVSLTAAGQEFLTRARTALEIADDAANVAQSLARAATGALTIGFVGPPPTLSLPGLFAALSHANPGAEVSFQDLSFPCGPTARWLGSVDAAICHRPAAEANLSMHTLRAEARAVVMRTDNPLARAEELTVAEVADETFVSYHPDVQPEWARFHSLDDARGGPPERTTEDHVLTSLQMLAVMSSSAAITTVPLCDARLAQRVMPAIAVIPLAGAPPALISLVWRRENHNPLLDMLVAAARSSTEAGDGV
jgi:DNA-binding transcriptional LysR family regulator